MSSSSMFSFSNISSLPSVWIWLGIALCVVHSALFAGLNLAVFSLSQLRLQIEADGGNADAARILDLRKNSNQVLATIIWGNVSINVLLTLFRIRSWPASPRFLFSAVAITLLGEIIPQAYFSRNALRMTGRFLPFLEFLSRRALSSGEADGAVARLVARRSKESPILASGISAP